ncbi:type II secretion system F family protein [Cohnella herbarum]|uniref:Type II secretion protein F n=1 Tax=Cohnella herbarum TaxID=2728023 RepID=A0A7Z2VQF9_9BACL|nr:type II secretion system F family protein [Cohnella herbarum]QJD87402.1 type II secretion protein F [Cohnella herbarum]
MSGWAMVLYSAVLLALYGVLTVRALSIRRKERFRPNVDPFVVLLSYRPLWNKLQPWMNKLRIPLALLNGGTCTLETLIGWSAESIGLAYLTLMVTGFLAIGAENPALLFVGAILAGILPALRAKELYGKVKKRHQSIVMELPELLSKLLLMVNAGENVMRALARTVEQKQGIQHPLYVELNSALEGLKRGESLSIALEEMGRRCAVPEVKLFATTLLINARRGGDAFVPALRELTRQMWDKRKAIARTLGEQASSRLAFPLTIVFLLIMVLVGAPTVFMM